jgi:predicted TIM-barrel fold metal-dependent hydrolase
VWGHCGHTGLDIAGLDEIAAVANIVAETSCSLTVTARLAVRRLGPARVLFGTEYPLQHPTVELAKAEALGLGRRDRYAVMWGNACRILTEGTTWPRS